MYEKNLQPAPLTEVLATSTPKASEAGAEDWSITVRPPASRTAEELLRNLGSSGSGSQRS